MKLTRRIRKQSPLSGKFNEMEISYDPADYTRWQNGALIQEAMPYLNPSQREFLMTGIVDSEWDAAFGENE